VSLPERNQAMQTGFVPRAARLDSIDLLRGLVMMLMALDHVRDFFFTHEIDPVKLTETTPALFFTRWISHFCAPTFLLLAGVGAALYRLRGKTTQELSWFLLTRGMWMIFLEWVVVRTFGWAFNFDFTYLPCWVIWTLGWSMILLSGLAYLPQPMILGLGILLMGGHHLLDGWKGDDFGAWNWLWHFLHDPRELLWTGHGFHALEPKEPPAGFVLGAGYPLIPWVGVMATGFGLGPIFQWDARRRRKCLLWLGLGCLGLFFLIRGMNGYGETEPWSVQANPLLIVLSFLNCTKQPPSLCFLLMTLGMAFLLLAAWNAGVGGWAQPVLTFGRVPLFFYLLHLPLIHALCVAAAWWQAGVFPHWLFTNPPLGAMPETFGFGLPVVYGVWLLVLVVLYPACRWYAQIKRQARSVWLSYL
jgi:uncharacterized membrane protein